MANLFIYAPLLCKGLLVTLGAWLIASIISFCVGTWLGIWSCKQLASNGWSFVIRSYVFIARGIPAYVQILIAYFVLPSLLGIHISGFWAAVGALGFCSSGYVAEIVRGGINVIGLGQWEACFVLGYSRRDTLWRIILPQAFRNILPSLLGEAEQLLKRTALLSTIGITELTRTGMNIISRELNPIPVYILIAVIYLVLGAILHGMLIYFEKRERYGSR